MKEKPKVVIYTDGAAKGNPGPGGYGCILQFIDHRGTLWEKKLSQGYKSTTNNRMELLAVIRGLQALNRPCLVDLYSDSRYVIDANNKGWLTSWEKNKWKKSDGKDCKNVDLWTLFLEVSKDHTITFHWIKGHNGNPQNEECDKLATEAAEDTEHLMEDEGR